MLRDQRRTTPSASQDAIHGPVSSNDKVAWGWNTIDPTRSLWPVTIGTKDPDLNLTYTLFLFVQSQWLCYLCFLRPWRIKNPLWCNIILWQDAKIDLKMFLVEYLCNFCGCSRLCSKENWREPSALKLYNLGCPAYDLYEKSKIFWSPESKN